MKKKTRKKNAPAAPARTRFVKAIPSQKPAPEPAPEPGLPEGFDEAGWAAAMRRLFRTERRGMSPGAMRDLLTAPPPFLRGQGKLKRRRARDGRGLRLLSVEQIA